MSRPGNNINDPPYDRKWTIGLWRAMVQGETMIPSLVMGKTTDRGGQPGRAERPAEETLRSVKVAIPARP